MLTKIICCVIVVLSLYNISIAADALDEVNAERARHGLRPFKRDNNLTLAAEHCCKYRARHFIQGHCSHLRSGLSDFHFIPEYKHGPFKGRKVFSNLGRLAAGCACWNKNDGWGSCCTYENHIYAGAWWEIGKDGRRYMHLFVRD